MTKILIFSDLHIYSEIDILISKNILKNKLNKHNYDLILIAGDIFETSLLKLKKFNPYKTLHELFNQNSNIPIICVLGNHEFFNYDINEVLDFYEKKYKPNEFNVHYLDIIQKYDFKVNKNKTIRFIGNVLWYDGSLKSYKNQKINDFENKTWSDYLIKNFDPIKESEKCINIIKKNISKNYENILLTHCVPHTKMNLHKGNYNIFSGHYNIIDQLLKKTNKLHYCVSGHTHLRNIGVELKSSTKTYGIIVSDNFDNFLLKLY